MKQRFLWVVFCMLLSLMSWGQVATAPYGQLADSLVAQMTLKEKVNQMYGEKKWYSLPKFLVGLFIQKRFPKIYVGRNRRLNIPAWVLSDGPRGARVMDKKVRAVTSFPVAMARGASWDTDLEGRIHEAIAIEMRANKTHYAATPCVNLLRHPAWGRAQETYGEDPWLLGEMGLVAVKAIQKHHVMACPKHFALNSIENSRWVVDVHTDERTLREVYLPHFKKIIQKGHPASIMSAYNYFRGNQCSSSPELLDKILRKEWKFEGFVSSDWVYGLNDGIGGIRAGLDVEMPWQQQYKFGKIKKGIRQGLISESRIDTLVTRVLKTRLAYAFAEDSMAYPPALIASPKHIALAREAAEKSMVLLKNENILPFSKKANKTIAVIGRLADLPNIGDHGSSDCRAPYVVTPYQGIKALHDALGNTVVLNDGSNLEEAKRIAATADEVILVVGYTYQDEGEYIILSKKKMQKSAKAHQLVGKKKGTGGDRLSLELLPSDELLIQTLAPLHKKLAVVYIGGSAITMNNWADKVPAILFAWYAGMEGGNALANILYGNVNPSGKLPFSIAKSEADYPFFNPYIDSIFYGYYHGYTLLEKQQKTAAYPFGFGLSYTDFTYANLDIKQPIVASTDTLRASITLKNTGTIAGEEVVQLYIGFRNSQIDRPLKLLRGFEKVLLQANEAKTIAFALPVEELQYYNPDTQQWELEKMRYEVYIGSSSRSEDLIEGAFEVR